MYKKIIDFLFQLLAVKQYLVFTSMFFILNALVLYILDAQLRPLNCPDMISLELIFSKTGLSQFINQCGNDGIRSHLIMLWVDYIFIFSYF